MPFLDQFPNTSIVYFHDSEKEGHPVKTPKVYRPEDVPAKYGAFFTVNGVRGDRLKTNLSNVNGVYCDLDYKGEVPEMQDLPIDWFNAAPSIINRSKNGYHCIWLLPETVLVDDSNRDEMIALVEGINRWFVKNWGSDNAIVDPARLLRIPGSMHRKDPNDEYEVHTVHTSDARYTLDELKTLFPPVYKEKKDVVYGALNDDAEKRIERMLKRPEVARLWNNEVGDDEKSETDQALCNHLAFWLGKDPVAMEQAWLQSPKGQRDKVKGRADYRKMTIDTAIAATKRVYTPKGEDSGDPCPERTRFLYVRENPDPEKNGKDVKEAMQSYFVAFYKWVAHTYPHLRYEIGRTDTFWDYDETEGTYYEIAQPTMAGIIIRLLRDEGLDTYTTESQVRRIILNFTAYQERGVTLDDFSLPTGWLHVANGWLELETLVLHPHTPERLSLFKMDTEYNPDAACPLYDQFLDVDTQMKADQVRVIDQFSGYILTDGIEQHTSLIIEGRKGCGKSMLLEIWMNMLGHKAVPLQLTALQGGGERFIGQTLAHKNLIWFDEANPRTANINEFFQNLITGEKIRIERKGVQGDDYVRNTLKVVLSLNEMPDHMPVGMDRRYRHIVFHRSFYEEGVVDPNYKEKVLENEKSGILNRMLRGLADLRKMGRLTVIAGEEERKREYSLTSDDFSSFLSDHFEPTPKTDTDVRYTYKQMRDAFVSEYPKGYNKQLTVRGFNKKLLATRLPEFKHITTAKSGSERGYKGLKLKNGHTWGVNDYEPIQVFGETVEEDW